MLYLFQWFLTCVCVCLCMCMHVCTCTCYSIRVKVRTVFSPSTVCILGTEFRSPGLMAVSLYLGSLLSSCHDFWLDLNLVHKQALKRDGHGDIMFSWCSALSLDSFSKKNGIQCDSYLNYSIINKNPGVG